MKTFWFSDSILYRKRYAYFPLFIDSDTLEMPYVKTIAVESGTG